MRARFTWSSPASRARNEDRAADARASDCGQACVLSQSSDLRDTGAGTVAATAIHARLKTIERGATVFAKGDPGTSLFAILEGQVKVISFSAQGKYAVFNVLSAGDIFGEIALLDGGERTADVIAIADCKLLVIERRDFLPLVHSRPDVAQKLIEVLCGRLRNTSRQVEEVMFLDLSAKLARTLLRLGDSAGGSRIALTQSEIAQIIGASRESTNKQLRDWENSELDPPGAR